ncbi:hypothetical protein [Rarobacter faecitabidus]|nr:hypothetical protein [Rarobacter faecitabidus]
MSRVEAAVAAQIARETRGRPRWNPAAMVAFLPPSIALEYSDSGEVGYV